jgi:hypothetical protein
MGNSLALGEPFYRIRSRFKTHVTAFHPGMHGKGIFIPDVNASVGFRVLDTFSDVLAIYQEPVRLFVRLPFSLMLLQLTFSPESGVHGHAWRRDREVGYQNVVTQPKAVSIQSIQLEFYHTSTYDWAGPVIGRQHGRSTGTLRPQIPARVHPRHLIPWPRELP